MQAEGTPARHQECTCNQSSYKHYIEPYGTGISWLAISAGRVCSVTGSYSGGHILWVAGALEWARGVLGPAVTRPGHGQGVG